MAYKRLELLFFPVLFSACLYIADFWLLFNLPFGETLLSLLLQALLLGSLALPLVGIWAIKRHGSFVMSADKKGMYYKKLEDPQKIVFIPWASIHKISITETNKRSVVIETTLNKYKKDKLPIPCNGSVYFLESGTICMEFNTSFWYKTANILNNLNKLRPGA